MDNAIPTDRFAELMASAITNGYVEPRLFRALLDVPIYSFHLKAPSLMGQWQPILIGRPDGYPPVCLIYLEISEAQKVQPSHWRIAGMPGRYFFELARGATLALKAGEGGALLITPEQVQAMLDGVDCASFNMAEMPTLS